MSGLEVLLLESDKRRTEKLRKSLEKEGYIVRIARDSDSLIAESSANPPDLVLLDLDLPGGEGLQVLKLIHDAQPEIPIITQTANPEVEHAVEAMRRGANNYISKKDPIETLLEAVSHALEKKRIELESLEKARARKIRTFDDPKSLRAVDEILAKGKFSDSLLISYLQDIQKELRFLPQDALRFVARRVNVSLPRVYGIATFYKSFSLKPRGRHLIQVCLGTACHVKGGVNLLERFERELGVRAGETTYDDRFSLESVRCVGCCGLAPVFVIDGDFYGKMTQDKILDILDKYE